MIKSIQKLDLTRLRVEEDFGFQKLVIAETEKLPLADTKPGHAVGIDALRDEAWRAMRKYVLFIMTYFPVAMPPSGQTRRPEP
ncbi:MAG: hypothetical protein ACTTKN_02705 [Phocaeicola sp.]|uniref:hypothetical protein n=1 Tax=Phocaeicola sp. TaxID=2773926 RepID=UPI003FA0FEFA